ncbi:SNF2-related protein, partial [Arenibaculum sp.]|uniref:SNF2-related protein n=1 Tax=Arenibaculum sp. TaxID=2865862 RepID=UPI002E102E77|nr:SNF2-related protein [Arenibaculum sp.]
MPTNFHAIYFAHELTRSSQSNDVTRLSRSLLDAAIDLNPHQIEAALFALRSPLDTGVLLADEVGLGKTVEAGLLLLQSWAEHKRRLVVICPASLRRQWAAELTEKFGLPCAILDRRSLAKTSDPNPLDTDRHVSVISYGLAASLEGPLRTTTFDLVVMDEAHRLRNSWKPNNVIGSRLRDVLRGRRKVLLTATPLQNSTMELYGLASLVDEYIFGDVATFRRNFTGNGFNMETLRGRLRSFCHRTLRRDVQEYVQYTERCPITVPFQPTDAEQDLYTAVSSFLQRDEVLALPSRQRQLMLLVMRKLLASSTQAILGTLDTIIQRLEASGAGAGSGYDPDDTADLLGSIMDREDLPDEEMEDAWDDPTIDASPPAQASFDEELRELRRIRGLAAAITDDTKAAALLRALELGFAEMERTGAAQKALVFTESRRTQDYLRHYLETNGHAGSVVMFNGGNGDPGSRAILDEWLAANPDLATGSRPMDMRTALVERFRTDTSIMLATEAAAEGINLQFCSLVINYDLPWNPQRIEQRIGRCHRYGQRHDVVVINFINERNAADRRVYELLDQKFRLFRGVFGASDEVLGVLEAGIDL